MEDLTIAAGAALAGSEVVPPVSGSSRPSPFVATSGGSPGSHPTGHTPPTVLQRAMLRHLLDEEEVVVSAGGAAVPADVEVPGARQSDAVAAGAENGGRIVARTGTAGVAATRGAAVEPAYRFSPPPTAAQMRDNFDNFHSDFMERIVRTWPQALVTALSKKARASGLTCSGAKENAHKGTNVEMKTWALRINVAMRFANFIGRTVCIPATGPRPTDAELDRGVAKFFACLNPSTQDVINCFLDARRGALEVAGGGAQVQERTMKGYSAAIGFLFIKARMNGTSGVKLVPDCDGARSPWQKKGQMERITEKQTVREDPGEYTGNPMETEAIKDHKGAAEKEARKSGQHNKTSADVTPAIMSALYNSLVKAHIPARAADTPAADGEGTSPSATGTAEGEVAQPPKQSQGTTNHSATSNLSARQTDFLAYVFYAFLFKTLARPWTIQNLTYKDITLPDMLVAVNAQFENVYVLTRIFVLRCRIAPDNAWLGSSLSVLYMVLDA